ncbi:MAG: methylated-DNA--[protein]-cysteine S-methyltransferase [bacterium]
MKIIEPPEFEFYSYIFKDEKTFHGGVASRRGLCTCTFGHKKLSDARKILKDTMSTRTGKIKYVKDLKDVDDDDCKYILNRFQDELDQYFHGKLKRFTLPIEIGVGTDFDRKVWMSCERIPYGETEYYKNIASRIGDPKMAKDIGDACRTNPLPIIIPCHRVLESKQKIGTFSGGVVKKRMLLKLEDTHSSVKN